MNPTAVAARDTNIYNEFKEFISVEKIKLSEKKKIQEWVQSNGPLYLEIGTDKQWYEYGYYEFSKDYLEQNPVDVESSIYSLDFNGVLCDVYISDFSQVTLRDTYQTVTLIVVFTFFSLVMFIDNRNKMKKIKIISQGVHSVEENHISPPIEIKGNDEFGYLASSINSMSHSLIQANQLEKDVWQTNYELITAMSHDVRTPLTILLGYLDFLSNREKISDKQQDEYIQLSIEKANQIKDLTNELFQYFLVFTSKSLPLNPTKIALDSFVDCCLGEYFYLLENENFQLEMDFAPVGDTNLDLNFFRRVMDNITSNLLKYADRNFPVCFSLSGEHQLQLTITNVISLEPASESNKIGMKICCKIMDLLGGSFHYRKENNLFVTKVTLPPYIVDSSKS